MCTRYDPISRDEMDELMNGLAGNEEEEKNEQPTPNGNAHRQQLIDPFPVI
jgi:hypothetical protein